MSFQILVDSLTFCRELTMTHRRATRQLSHVRPLAMISASLLLSIGDPPRADAAEPLIQRQCLGHEDAPGDGYDYQFRGDRCEGRCHYRLANTTDLHFVSLGPAIDSYEQNRRTLTVSWEPFAASSDITLSITSPTSRTCYQMDTTLPMQRMAFRWPRYIMTDLGIELGDLAVTGYIRTSTGFAMYPVHLDSTRRAISRSYTLGLVPTRLFTELYITIVDASQQRRLVEQQPIGRGFYAPGMVVLIPLPANLPRERALHLGVLGRSPSGDAVGWTDILLPSP
jgi:hypothetical protein